MTFYTVNGILKRCLPILFIVSFISISTGQMLNLKIDALVDIPALLILIPPFIKVGGNTSSTLSARLSTALHTGIADSAYKYIVFKNNLIAIFTIGISALFLLSILVYFISGYMGIGIEFFKLLKICLGAGIITLILIYSLTIIVTLVSYKYGVDPDDTVIPIVTTIADFIGVAGICIALHILGIT